MVAGKADCCLAAEQGCGQTVKVRQLWFRHNLDPTLSFLPHMGLAQPVGSSSGISPAPAPACSSAAGLCCLGFCLRDAATGQR